jgi:hypothetical protein
MRIALLKKSGGGSVAAPPFQKTWGHDQADWRMLITKLTEISGPQDACLRFMRQFSAQSITSIEFSLGYKSESAFGNAFKRVIRKNTQALSTRSYGENAG